MTQKEQVIQYMKDFGTITPFEAFADLGITKLATRVSELRKEGVKIHGEWMQKPNRWGKTVMFMRYSLEEESK